MYKVDGRWKANTQEFLNDTERIYDWVYVVDSMSYTKFDKSENIEQQIIDMADEASYEAMIDESTTGELHKVKVIGKIRKPVEDFERYIIVNNGIIEYGVHPSIIKLL